MKHKTYVKVPPKKKNLVSSFIPLPPHLQVKDVELVELSEENEKLFQAMLAVKTEKLFLASLQEWTHVDRAKKGKLIQEHTAKLEEAEQVLKSVYKQA